MEKIIKTFLKRLTNISSNNRSICLLKAHKGSFVDIHKFDFLYKQPSFSILEQLIAGKRKIMLCDEQDSRDESVNELSRQLRQLSRKQRMLAEETGAKDLYIGWPFVNGKLSDGTLIRCPLLFFSVQLVLEQSKWYVCQEYEELQLNKSFVLAYAHFNKIKITDEWLENSFSEYDTDATQFRTQLYEFLKNSPLAINFNQELFANKLENYRSYKSDEYQSIHKNGELKLYSQAVLGIFPQAGSYLVPDYEQLILEERFASIETILEQKNNFKDQSVRREENSYYAFPIDASQEEVLQKVYEGKSMVVQGPPGSGKSQLIANLITDFVTRGKRVLVVCQKKAALDVVYERLHSKELAAFAGLVHDTQADRPIIAEQLLKQINRLDEYEKNVNSLNAIQLERQFTQASRQIKLSSEVLEQFRHALYSTSEFAISVKELYMRSHSSSPKIDLQNFYTEFTYESASAFETKIKNYIRFASVFEHDEYVWKNRVPFTNFYRRDLQVISDYIYKIVQYRQQVYYSATQKLAQLPKGNLLSFFAAHRAVAIFLQRQLHHEDDYFVLQKWMNEKTDEPWFLKYKERIINLFSKYTPECSLSVEKLDEADKKIRNYLSTRDNFFSKLIWDLFSADKSFIKKLCADNKLFFDEKSATQLLHKIELKRQLHKNCQAMTKKKWVQNIPRESSLEAFVAWFEQGERLLRAKAELIGAPELNLLLPVASTSSFEIFKETLSFVEIIATNIEKSKKEWRYYLSIEMIEGILENPSNADLLVEIVHRDFDMLVAYDEYKSTLLSFELDILQKLINHPSGKNAEEACTLFRKSVYAYWIASLEEKYPVLKIVSTFQMEQEESLLREAIVQKRICSSEIVKLRLQEQTFKDAEYNRLQNRITYRDLFHQVSKKKKCWPLRKLIENFEDEILKLIPCWLVSPETASALFSMKELFDLVVFDEASQCFAEHGIPAIYRGRQIVVAGDKMQLQPSNIYHARWEDEADDSEPDLEIDSLLDLCAKYLPSVTLQGHYRSRSLALIDFSNRYFYEGKLELVPHFNDMNHAEPAIEYHLVKGIWHSNTNYEEAEAIVKTTMALLKTSYETTIGIITFNYKQAELIAELLEKESIRLEILLPPSLFVKNIENVQGDERDVILFSIGYAPDKAGRFNMQFGNLNQEGGQNRLNVAVTRAKQKIIVVSSIMPQQLEVEQTLHEGPKLLKKYLEYAWEVYHKKYTPRPMYAKAYTAEWYLSNRISKALSSLSPSYVATSLPFADVAITKNGVLTKLILTDDEAYYAARNPREAHAYKIVALERSGWVWQRVFSRQFWISPDFYTTLVE